MSKMLILIDSNLSADSLKSIVPLEGDKYTRMQAVSDYLMSLSGGNQDADGSVKVGAVSAVASFINTGAATAAQAMTLLNVTLTAIASNPAANQFVPSATPATQAQNMVDAINASPDLSAKVVATRVDGQVIVTSKIPGAMSNGLQISLGNLSNVGTLVAFAGGSDGTDKIIATK